MLWRIHTPRPLRDWVCDAQTTSVYLLLGAQADCAFEQDICQLLDLELSTSSPERIGVFYNTRPNLWSGETAQEEPLHPRP